MAIRTRQIGTPPGPGWSPPTGRRSRPRPPAAFHPGPLRSGQVEENPYLQLVNPVRDDEESAKAAFRKFHWKAGHEARPVMTPDCFPQHLVMLGWLRRYRGENEGGDLGPPVAFPAGRVYVATDSDMDVLYIGPVSCEFSEFNREWPYLTELHYETPIRSKMRGRLWRHDFRRPVHTHLFKDWIVGSGENLSVTKRGIEG